MSSALTAKSVAHSFRQRACLLVAICLYFGASSGCMSWRMALANRQHDPMAGAPRLSNSKNPQLQEVVEHLNQNTDRILSWRADNVRIQANGWMLNGKLAVEKDNHVRLIVSSPVGNEVDLGSNDERFWIWSRRMEPAFVTCKHENIGLARQKMGIPFEPNWLMQTLGVAPLSLANVKLESSPNHEQLRLVEEVETAHGYPLRRVVLVDLKHGTIIEHSLYDNNAVRIALAKLSGHVHDKATGIVLPHRVQLEWPQNQMAMTMDLGKIQINPTSIPSQVWTMPEIGRCEVVNLDEELLRGEEPPGEQKIAARRGASRQMSERDVDTTSAEDSEEEQETEPTPHGPSEQVNTQWIDRSGRTRLSEAPKAIKTSRSSDDAWYQ